MTHINITIDADSAEELKGIFKGLAGEVPTAGNAPKPEPKKRSAKKKDIEAADIAEETLAMDAPEPAAEAPKEEEPKAEEPKEEPKADTSKEEPAKEAPKEEPVKEQPKELTEEMKVELRTMVAKYIHEIPNGKERVKQFLKGKNLSKVTELAPADVEEFKALLAC